MPEDHPLPLVVAVGGDPGGASALAPVIEDLQSTGRVRLDARAYRHACAVWKKRGIQFYELDEQAGISLPDDTQLVLTSTSLNGIDLEKRFTVAARAQGIPTVSVLDFWSNYRRRFSSSDELMDCLPDCIAIMDTRARDEMLAEGFTAEQLVITGQPAFDGLAAWRAGFTPERRRIIRENFGVSGDSLLVVFASQPFSALCGSDPSSPGYCGFDERSVAGHLLKALETAVTETGRGITLVLRPHPREDIRNFDHLQSDRVRIRVATEGDQYEVVAAADLVVGMNTVLLIEACYLGCVVVSLQPNLRGPDSLPTNRLGYSRAVYSEREIAPTIRELLFDDGARRRVTQKLQHFQVAGCASVRVADIVFSLLQSPISGAISNV